MMNSEKQNDKKIWNYNPSLPISNSPVFEIPWVPRSVIKRLTFRWIKLTPALIFLLLAVGVYQFLVIDVSKMATLSFTWIGEILLRNLIIFILFAGSMHVYLFSFSKQGQLFKFDLREQMKNNPSFTFRDQVLDNMFWSLASGVTIWTLYEVMYFWGIANGVIPSLTFIGNEIWFFVWMLVLPLLHSSHFYWVHRFLHWPPLYRRVHSLHHRNVNVGPWSGMSMHPVETFVFISSVLIHFVIPSHPIIFLLHLYMKAIGPIFSHAGYEKIVYKDTKIIDAGDFHHQLHHRYFECNYGTTEVPWDKWFNTFHDGTEAATTATNERRRKKYSRV
jgi:sterol desaturase/sphingolipid hydroxylase (fatty acid hydroxylase superfamily)